MRFLSLISIVLLLGAAGPASAQELPPEHAPEVDGDAVPDEDAASVEDVEDADDPGEDGEDTEADESENSPSLIEQCKTKAAAPSTVVVPPVKRFPYVDWNGSFRFRADLMGEVDLATYEGRADGYSLTSLYLPTLINSYANENSDWSQVRDESENTLGTTNMRLRLGPEFRISDSLKVVTTVDFLDNIVLGSTPEYAVNVTDRTTGPQVGDSTAYSGSPGAIMSLDTLTSTQIPPSAGVNSFQDSIAVKEAYAEWVIAFSKDLKPDSFTLGTLKVGRYAQDWGLGILTHRGEYNRNDSSLTTMDRFRTLDTEWANYVDRISWRYDFGPVQAMVGYGWLSSGPTSRVAYDAGKQPYDIEQKDDLYQIEAAIYSRPETRNDFIERRKALFSGKPVFDWGLYVTYRRQEMTTAVKGDDDTLLWPDYVEDYSSLYLIPRNAWVITPDIWLRFDYRPDPKTRYFAALEGILMYGRVDNVDLKGDGKLDQLEILQWGVALETNFTIDIYSFGLDIGLASGDDADMMSVLTGQAVDPTQKGAMADQPWGSDARYGAFSFNRNYIVDMLLYREVLGGISNTAYFRGHFDFDILPTEEDAFGGAITVLYAMSMIPEAFPGDSRHLGLELGAHLFYEETNRFLATVSFAALIPLAGLDRPENYLVKDVGSAEAEWAWTLQGNLFLLF